MLGDRASLALLTDLYQLTMAYGYWRLGRAEQPAVFHLFFRKPPFKGGYAVAAGLENVVDYLNGYRFDPTDLTFLESLEGNNGQPLFDRVFLDYLGKLRLTIDVDAVPEGTVVFGQEPMLRIRGPILQAQLLETPLLNLMNFQTLIATKASRICRAAEGQQVLEFGLRRAQGIDGALSATRAAYIGGCAATSNVLAGKELGIPVKGTHAHSWVMSFDTESEAFERYAEVLPNNCVFLVDTYDTLIGVEKAIEVGRRLRERGHEMVGIRLDSGDLAYLAIEARKLLDAAGFPKAVIVASNDLDEHLIEDLRRQDAPIAVWGVGTKLVTAYDQPALGGVYKLGALQADNGVWSPKLKVSEQTIKTSIPGTLQVRRFFDDEGMVADMIYDETLGAPTEAPVIVDAGDSTRQRKLGGLKSSDLLRPVMREGRTVADREPLSRMQERTHNELTSLHPTVRRFKNPHEYPVGLEQHLFQLRDRMIRLARNLPVELEEQEPTACD